MTKQEMERRLGECRDARQKFESGFSFAKQRQRPADYENAMGLAVAYCNVCDGLVAAIANEQWG